MQLLTRTSSRLALALAAGLLFAGLPAPHAKAADLGGDCCADLEERVAELEATTVRKGNRKISLTISGWVNAGVVWWSDGFGSTDLRDPTFFDHNADIYVVNNSTSQTRFNIEGSGKIRENLSAGFSISIRPWGDKLGDVSQVVHNPTPNNIDIRNTYVFLDAKDIGKVQLGQQDSAADGAWYQDLGGSSTWISNVNPGAWNSGFHLRDNSGGLTDVTWGSVLQEMSDGQVPRIAFYSRQMAGFQFATSFGGNDTYATALYYANKFGTLNIAAGVGYDSSSKKSALIDQNVGTGLVDADHNRLNKLAMSGSIYESGSGLYGTLAWSKAYAATAYRNDATNWYGKMGWRRNVNGMGETNVYGEYDRTTDAYANDLQAHVWGVGMTQDLDTVGAVMYLGYRHTMLDNAIADPKLILTAGQTVATNSEAVPSQHFDAVLAGMVVNF